MTISRTGRSELSKYPTIESWASRLGYVVDANSEGYAWHRENEPIRGKLKSPAEVVEAILEDLRSEYGGER